jgi:phosphoribosylaminoimidazolecarboxamide formyltransferase / IMP cyclohydrolase
MVMPKALLSVYDKNGLLDFARGLLNLGWDLLASGGTAKLLTQNGLKVTEVADYTGSPEILGGRVKTLHPAIHGGLLARNTPEDHTQLQSLGWEFIDLVAVNLYPFEATVAKPDVSMAEAIEQIDIGGVALIRAAAKNHDRVTLVCDPQDYPTILSGLTKGSLDEAARRKLALKGFRLTSHYDQAISRYLDGNAGENLSLYPIHSLRYGENPHQSAVLLGYHPDDTPLGGQVLQGKELSYNNLLDLDSAWRAVVSYPKSSIVIVKHLTPCGIATNENQVIAYQAALASDPVSAFGGIIAANRTLEADTAQAISDLFVECIIAPGFDAEALTILAKKKNIRLVQMPNLEIDPKVEYRSVVRGILRQQVDLGDPDQSGWKVVTEKQPSAGEMAAMKFAWTACQHVKSNAIVFARGEATVGIGGGQPNRVDCVRIAAERAGEKSKGAVMASDAYFPFPDSVEEAAHVGIAAIVQPGGSVRDPESIEACNRLGISMVFTGYRHFRH